MYNIILFYTSSAKRHYRYSCPQINVRTTLGLVSVICLVLFAFKSFPKLKKHFVLEILLTIIIIYVCKLEYNSSQLYDVQNTLH